MMNFGIKKLEIKVTYQNRTHTQQKSQVCYSPAFFWLSMAFKISTLTVSIQRFANVKLHFYVNILVIQKKKKKTYGFEL